MIVAMLVPDAAFAGYREQGSMTLSLSGSPGYKLVRDRETSYKLNVSGDEYIDITNSLGSDYEALELTLSLSAGYYLIDNLELGLTGSLMDTRYFGGDLENFRVVDARLYLKRFLQTRAGFTPYLKAQGGISRLVNGDYQENNLVAGGTAGMEFFGTGKTSFFVELSSLYQFNGGSVSGTEWRNQVYVGITRYFDFGREKTPAFSVSPGLPPPLPGSVPDPLVERVREVEKQWENALEKLDRRFKQ